MELSKQIERELDWRIAELAELKKTALSLSDRKIAYGSQLRALWVMLYAHYEGFCKFVISIFLEELEKTGRVRHLFKDELIIFSLEDELSHLRKDTSAKSCYEYFRNTFNTVLNSVIKFKKNRNSEYRIIGENNLYSDDLLKMCTCICLSKEFIEGNRIQLNTLVSRRNEIAHGKEHLIKSLDDYKKYEDAALNVMIALALAVMESLETEEYLR